MLKAWVILQFENNLRLKSFKCFIVFYNILVVVYYVWCNPNTNTLKLENFIEQNINFLTTKLKLVTLILNTNSVSAYT